MYVLSPRLGVCILDSGFPNIIFTCGYRFLNLQKEKEKKDTLTLCAMTSASTLVSISIISTLLLENTQGFCEIS